MNLLESYRERLNVSEGVYKKAHDGELMDTNKKMAVARCLENVSSFMNEAFDAASGTQRTDMGLFKKFCFDFMAA